MSLAQKKEEFNLQDIELSIPAIKIRNIDAEITDLTYEIIADKVIVQGIIHKQVFYVGIDNIVHHQSDDMPFSTFVDIFGAAPGMVAQIDINIERILSGLSPDGTILAEKAILNIFVKVEDKQVIQVLLDNNGTMVELSQLIGEDERQLIIEKEITLNQLASKVDEIRAEVTNIEAEIITDKVIIQGTIHKQIFYVNQANIAVHQGEDLSFNALLEINGVTSGMDVDINTEIEYIGFDLSEDGNTLAQKIIIKISGRVSQAIQEKIAPGIDYLVKLPVIIGENTTQLLKVSEIVLEQPAKKIKGIDASIININTEVMIDKVIIQGTIHKQIYYIGNDDIEYHQAEDITFSTFIIIPGAFSGQFVRVEPIIEDIIFELLTDALLHQKLIIEIFAKIEEITQLYIAVGEPGLLAVIPVVIGENTKQILVEQEKKLPPIKELIIEFTTILQRSVVAVCQQIILDDIITLERPAIKIKNITAEVENVEAELILEDLVVVSGEVKKDISYVGLDDIVYHQNVIIPFSIEIELPEPISPGELNPVVTIENISFTLLDGGEELRELVVLKACLEIDKTELIRLVTLISGSGITTSTIQVRAEVVISVDPLITEEQIITVVTDVSDPEELLTTVIKETLVLDVVGVGKIPVEVIVFAE